MMRLGCERLFETPYRSLWEGKHIGLVTNYTGVDRHFRRTVDQLTEHGANVVRLFAAEHGFYGVAQAGEHVYSETDAKSGLEVVSLYNEKKDMALEVLDTIDVLMLEFQDVGVRFYTYISTMFRVMKTCSDAKVPLVILDRPNPIGGEIVEGNTVEEGYRSFVGDFNIPIRHGLTLGELASLYKDETSLNLDLSIVPMENWSRANQFPETRLEWIPPSPNMPTYRTAFLYPGMCFFEGTTLSEGRGTTMPFQWIGAPWIHGEALADGLNEIQLPGVHFRPVVFQPVFSKHAAARVEGVHVHVVDERIVKPANVGLQMIAWIKQNYPNDFTWLPPFKDRYFIDLLWGSNRWREDFDKGRSVHEIILEWEEEAVQFDKRRKKYLLY